MTLLLHVVVYAAIGICTVAIVVRIATWIKMPMHVRWELYPVAHEGERAHYGGSYLEEVDWWKKPRKKSIWGEIKVMTPHGTLGKATSYVRFLPLSEEGSDPPLVEIRAVEFGRAL